MRMNSGLLFSLVIGVFGSLSPQLCQKPVPLKRKMAAPVGLWQILVCYQSHMFGEINLTQLPGANNATLNSVTR